MRPALTPQRVAPEVVGKDLTLWCSGLFYGKTRDLANPSTYTKSKSTWMCLNITSRKSESTTVFLEIWGLILIMILTLCKSHQLWRPKNQDLIVTWLLVDLKVEQKTNSS